MNNKICLTILLLLPVITFGQAGMWTWVKGDSTPNSLGHFGVQGVADSTNTPPGIYEPCEWTDLQGNFWLFGGLAGVINGGTQYGDLWKYDIATNNWTWIKGPGTPNHSGVFGTKGIPSPSNYPPTLTYGMTSWVDKDGNLWMYGGYYLFNLYNTLWKYNIASNEWTWVNGDSSSTSDPPAVYGTKGIPSALNTPGGRQEVAASWVDANNDLWLFGGLLLNVVANLNDLWRYHITTNEWTWMSGDNTIDPVAVYGTKGIMAANNIPGGRNAYCTWKDANGKFWLFGGGNINYNNYYNDMWMYDPTINQWAWMSGTNNSNDPGNYGPLCKPGVNYAPSSRYENRARWVDGCGNFWMYGGSVTVIYQYNDLWSFNPVTLEWTLANGGSSTHLSPVYGTIGTASASNQPGCRQGALAFKSASDDLYLFGGAVNGWVKGRSDLWKYHIDPICPGPALLNLGHDTSYCGPFSKVLSANSSHTLWSTGQTGSQIVVSSPGTYWAIDSASCHSKIVDTIKIGVVGLPTAINLGNDTTYCNSINRTLSTGNSNTSWSTGIKASQITVISPGKYWASISNGCGTVSDTINISLSNSPPAINLGHDTTYCSAFSRVLISNNPNTLWSTGVTASQITVTNPGTYWAKVSNTCGIAVDTIHLLLQSASGSIRKKDDTLIAVGTGTVQWVNCEEKIPVVGATGNVFVPSANGAYAAIITNGPCKDTTGCLAIVNTGTEAIPAGNSIKIYPNPAKENINIILSQACNKCLFTVTDVTGREVMGLLLNGKENNINISSLAQGIYFISVSTSSETIVTKVVKQ